MTIISSMDENFSLSRKFLNFLKKLTKQFSLIKWQKYVLFNIAKLQIWFLTSICSNTFLNLFYCQVYISDTSNECNNNLSREQGGDSTKFQKVDVQSDVQLTPTSVIKENKRTFNDYYEVTKEEDTKNASKLAFNLFEIFIK